MNANHMMYFIDKKPITQGLIESEFLEVMNILDFYIYTLYKAKYQLGSGNHNNKGSVKKSTSSNEEDQPHIEVSEELKEICLTTIEKILYFLTVSKFKYSKLSSEALDFANKINT
jgi:hypothetical protein